MGDALLRQPLKRGARVHAIGGRFHNGSSRAGRFKRGPTVRLTF